MLFYVSWQPRSGQGSMEAETALELFSRWTPPEGMEFKAFYGRVDGGGFAIAEVDSAETIFEAATPWAGVYFDYEMIPIVQIDKAVELVNKGIAFRNG